MLLIQRKRKVSELGRCWRTTNNKKGDQLSILKHADAFSNQVNGQVTSLGTGIGLKIQQYEHVRQHVVAYGNGFVSLPQGSAKFWRDFVRQIWW